MYNGQAVDIYRPEVQSYSHSTTHAVTNNFPRLPPIPIPISNSTGSSSNSERFNRASVFNDPVYGAKLVMPPPLTVVNQELSLSEGEARSSGCSWDDTVGVEIGAKIERMVSNMALVGSSLFYIIKLIHPSGFTLL
jgi:hypothetical protein